MNKTKSKAWAYRPHYKDEAEGHIFMDKPGACIIELTGAAAMTQEELNRHGVLIAAAPELLAALKDALFQFEHNGDESDSDRNILNQMQAAIAKAEGRAE